MTAWEPAIFPWEQEQPESGTVSLPDTPTLTPAAPALAEPVEPLQFPAPLPHPDADAVPYEFLQQDAVTGIINFLQEYGPDRGPFKLGRDGEQNQQLPGITLPPWMMQSFNFLVGHPRLPYNHDRPTMVRDLLFMGLAGMVQALQQWTNDPELANTRHIISHEATLRHHLHEEEMMQNHFTEDLATAARALELRMDAHQPDAVYDELDHLFAFVLQIRDKRFWQPTFLRFMIKIPEIRNAIRYVGEQDKYAYDPQWLSWNEMIIEEEAQRRDWDAEYETT